MSSEQIYYTYYSPTDWQHPNKVKYTENLSNAGDLLVTSSSGFENLNARKVIARDDITSSWGAGIQKQNDFNYNVSVTNGFKFNSSMVNNIQVVSASSNIANTIAKQITIDDFDYDTIFGLTRANPNVIDYNWYAGRQGNTKQNIFGNGNPITNKETTRIGPKLFLYKGTSNDYQIGNITTTITKNVPIDNGDYGTVINDGTYNNILKYKDQKIEWNGSSVDITNTTTFYKAEEAWPYKIQYNPNQWYHILTNGQKSALLTLPYWDPTLPDLSAVDPERYYVLNVKKDKNTDNPIYSYYKLDRIVENNYYYIVSYFDTRPTVRDKQLTFNSNSSSLFNENTIQILPLTKFDYQTFIALHDDSMSSCIASCMPVSYTTSRKPVEPLFILSSGIGLDGSTSYPENFGLNPIAIKYEKNITITTTLNYTIANMTNLSNILTGWNYLHKNFTDSTNYKELVRGNLPFINAGIIVYIPTTNTSTTNNITTNTGIKYTDLDSNNKFIRFYKWLNSFNTQDGNDHYFWHGINTGYDESKTVSRTNINFSEYFKNIYNYIGDDTNDLTQTQTMSPTSTICDVFYKQSTPAFINFNSGYTTTKKYLFNDHLAKNYVYADKDVDSNIIDSNTDFLVLPVTDNDGSTQATDVIKFINTLCVPINNALNTTHTATDNYTFRLKKSRFKGGDNTDYFYIIGTYIYITKNIPYDTFSSCPHYLGFSPSTNITTHELLSKDTIKNAWLGYENGYQYPQRIVRSFVCDSQNYLNVFDGLKYENTTNMTDLDYYALMKDIFVTPSLYMTLNESVGDV